jgi:hypothetical protein
VAAVCVPRARLVDSHHVASSPVACVCRAWSRYFVIHLFKVVTSNKSLMDVLRAVTQNGRQLLLTSLLLAMIVWCFAVWGHEMRDDFLIPKGMGADDAYCRSPGHCWLEIVNSLATGDVGDLLMSIVAGTETPARDSLSLPLNDARSILCGGRAATLPHTLDVAPLLDAVAVPDAALRRGRHHLAQRRLRYHRRHLLRAAQREGRQEEPHGERLLRLRPRPLHVPTTLRLKPKTLRSMLT